MQLRCVPPDGGTPLRGDRTPLSFSQTAICASIITMLPCLFVASGCRDAKCGKIQCQGGANRPVIGTNAVSIETNIPLQAGGRILCRGTHVYLGDDMPDPGLVLTGTKCGNGLVRIQIHVGRMSENDDT